MSTPFPPRARTLALQGAVLIFVLAASMLLLYGLGAFAPKATFPHKLTYRVAGSAGQAFVTYTLQNGAQTQRQDVTLPWKTSITLAEPTTVILTAGSSTGLGTLECSLLLDGEAWKQQTAEPPEDRVACAGLVR
jgi:hypothetical protein